MYRRGPQSDGPAKDQPRTDGRERIPAVRWSPARPSNSAQKRNGYDPLPSLDDAQSSQAHQSTGASKGHQYDQLPAVDDVQSLQSPQAADGPKRNQYDRLPSLDESFQATQSAIGVQRNQDVPPRMSERRQPASPRSPYGTPIFVEDGPTGASDANAVRAEGLAQARLRYGKIPPADRSIDQTSGARVPDSKPPHHIAAEARAHDSGYLPDARPQDIAAAGPRIGKPSVGQSAVNTAYLPPARMTPSTKSPRARIPDVGDASTHVAPSPAHQKQRFEPNNGHYVVETTNANGVNGENASKVMKLSDGTVFSGNIIFQKANGGLVIKDAENPSDLVHLPASAGKQLSQHNHNRDMIEQSIVSGRNATPVKVYHLNGQWSLQSDSKGIGRAPH